MGEVLVSRQPLGNEENVWEHKGNHSSVHELGTQGGEDKVKKEALHQGQGTRSGGESRQVGAWPGWSVTGECMVGQECDRWVHGRGGV